MIRKYKPEDFDNIERNEFYSEGFIGSDRFKEMLLNENVHTFTQTDGDNVLCIIVFFTIGQGIYQCGLVFSQSYLSMYAKEFKNFLYDSINAYNIRRLETESVDCSILNRWHDFLGFTMEGVKREYVDFKDYRMWSILQKDIKRGV